MEGVGMGKKKCSRDILCGARMNSVFMAEKNAHF